MEILTRTSSYKSKLGKIIIITTILQNSFFKQSCLTPKWEMLGVPCCKAIMLTGGDRKSEEIHVMFNTGVWPNLQRLCIKTTTCNTNSVHKQKMWINGPSFFLIHCIKFES